MCRRGRRSTEDVDTRSCLRQPLCNVVVVIAVYRNRLYNAIRGDRRQGCTTLSADSTSTAPTSGCASASYTMTPWGRAPRPAQGHQINVRVPDRQAQARLYRAAKEDGVRTGDLICTLLDLREWWRTQTGAQHPLGLPAPYPTEAP